jgi:hypothetical protein
MLKACGAAELLKDRAMGALSPPPAGVMVMLPV